MACVYYPYVKQKLLLYGDLMVSMDHDWRAIGWRCCSYPASHALVAVIRERGAADGHVEFFPSPGLPYCKDGIPARIAAALDEAVECYKVRAYRGAAALIRRAVEITCDEQGAKPLKGHPRTLGPRIDLLKGKLSSEVLEAMHSVKFLGNDAMHLDAEDFDKVDAPEVEAAFAVTLEILRQLYQAKALLGLLKKLQRPAK